MKRTLFCESVFSLAVVGCFFYSEIQTEHVHRTMPTKWCDEYKELFSKFDGTQFIVQTFCFFSSLRLYQSDGMVVKKKNASELKTRIKNVCFFLYALRNSIPQDAY